MDTEQLKLVLDMLRAAGVSGENAFFWWLVFDKGLPVLVWIAALVAAWRVVHLLVNQNTGYNLGAQIRDALGVGYPGQVTQGEATDTLARVHQLLEIERRYVESNKDPNYRR